MLRIVLDTNVLISGTYWTGDSYRILEFMDEGKIIGITTKEILKEYDRIIHSEEILARIDEIQLLQRAPTLKIFEKMTVIEPIVRLNVIAHDPDNKFLEAAVEGKANYIVSRDHHLLDLKEYQGIKIITPEKFLKIIQTK